MRIRTLKGSLFIFLLHLLPIISFAQNQITVTGVVSGSEGPLSNASVVIKGSQKGVVTSTKGRYTIDDVGATDVLVFSSVGYETKEIEVNGRRKINVELNASVTALDQVVVVGYGTVKKKDLTGSVVALRPEDFNQGPVVSADQLFSGKASGVQVIQNSAQPGGGISVSIRGTGSINAGNDPLYVVDGLPIDNTPAVSASGANFLDSRSDRNPLNSINPADIQSIQILKDASATAIYGSRGANGVVIITTKNGRKGALKVNYDGYYGIQNVANKIRLLNAQEYKTTMNALIDQGAGSSGQKVSNATNGTNWLDELYRPNAPMQNHNLSFGAGNDNLTFRVSLNYFNQDGILINSNYQRFAGRVNLEYTGNDKFKMGLNLSSSYGKDKYVSNGFDLNERAGVLYAAFNYDPTLPLFDSSGHYTISPDMNIDNPLAIANGKHSYSNLYRTLGTIYGEYSILPELTAKINIGTDVVNQRRDSYIDRSTIEGFAAGGIASALQGRNSNYLIEGTLRYNNSFGQHSINAVAGVTGQRFSYDDLSASGRSFPSDVTGTDNLSLADPSSYVGTTSRSSNSLLSYLARINYSYRDKYLFTSTFRADGSSRFGPNTKYGYFPSVALAWKIDRENFLQSVKAISTLKLRASWGMTGNQDIGNYQSLSTFGSSQPAVFNDVLVSTTSPTRMPNPNIKWEASQQLDVGLDFGFFNGRISGSVDWYNKNTNDLLLSLPIPRETGFTSMLTNVGKVQNTGLDFGISTQNLVGALRWSTDINLSTLKNKVIGLGGIPNIITGSAGQAKQIGIITVGEPLYSFYGYDVTGIWQTGDNFSAMKGNFKPGDFKFRDVNGDSIINASDRVVLGNSFPKLIYSMTNNFTYKNFGLYIFIEGVSGIKMLNNNLLDTYFPANLRRNRLAEPLLNRWTETNPSNKYPSFVNSVSQAAERINSRTVENASYLKLNTVKLSYNFRHLSRAIKEATVYISGENLITFTDYTGYDPAVNPNNGSNFRIDWNAYPTARTFILGINVNL